MASATQNSTLELKAFDLSQSAATHVSAISEPIYPITYFFLVTKFRSHHLSRDFYVEEMFTFPHVVYFWGRVSLQDSLTSLVLIKDLVLCTS